MHRRLLSLTRDARFPLVLTILSGFLAGLLTIYQAWLLSRGINDVFLEGKTLAQVMGVLRLILFAVGGRALLAWLMEISANAVAVKIKTDLRNRLFAHLQELGPTYARGQRTGELTATVAEGIEALDAYYSQYLPQLVITALIPISILMVVLPIDVLSGIVLLVTAPLIPLFMIMIGRGAEVITNRQYETLRLLSAHFLDSLQGLTTLKLFNQSRGQAKNIAQVSDRYRDITLSVLRITFLSALALELLATLSTAIIAVEIGFRLLYAKMEFQPALFLLILAPEFYMPLRALGMRFHAGMSGTTAARRIYEILDLEISEQRTGKSHIPTLNSPFTIQLDNLSYTYPNETTPALQNINLVIDKGRHIALVGRTGAGKSTLVNLLLGFIHPSSGQITTTIQGKPSALCGPPSIDAIAWVPQKPYLFHDDIAANIRLGNPQATDEQVVAAACAAHLHEFIETLPQKYRTVIGEGGARLSSGQAQRIALARAFLKNAPILILDEPTSSLDPELEALLEESTRRIMQGRTTITIAHRLNTIFRSDLILVLDQGRIVEQGTHRALLANNGLYSRMVKTDQGEIQKQYPGMFEGSKVSDIRKPAFDMQKDALTGPKSKIEYSQYPILLRLLSFLNGSWSLVALSVLLGACTIGSNVALMGTSAWLISTAALHPSVADLGVSVVGVRFFGIARGLFRYAERLVSHNTTFRLLGQLRVWFYEKLEPLAPARLMEFHAGDLLAHIIGDVETLENFYVRVVSPPLTAILVGLFTSIFLASFHPLFVPAFLLFFLALGLFLPLLTQILSRRSAADTITLRADLHTQLVDGIQGMADLLAFGCGAHHLKEMAINGKKYGNAQRRMTRVTALHSGLSTLLTNLGLWTILVLAIPLVERGSIAGTMLASLTLLTFAAFEAVTPLPFAAQMWISSRAAARRLFAVVDTEPAVKDDIQYPVGDARYSISDALRSNIEFLNITFSYPSQSTPALEHITLNLHQGGTVAVVGPSGAGKSTLVNLLLRFWDYGSGEITLGSESLKTYPQHEIRARIGLVSPNTYFFNTSIRENLRFARRGVTEEEMISAAKSAQIHDFIMGLPEGYATLIGEQGLRLSGGERQRLAIARAIIKDAPILILDEPTANLDPLTGKQVLEILYGIMKQKTSMLVTHHLVGLENVDEILVMDHGRIVERGTQDQLMKADGLYRRLWDSQNRILDDAPY